MAWSDEDRATVLKMYADGNPTAQNSSELVKQISVHFNGISANSVRMVLTKAEVYVKIDTGKTPAGGGGEGKADAPKRTSKADAVAELVAAISDAAQEVDDEILGKLTGKAALYFAGVIRGIGS